MKSGEIKLQDIFNFLVSEKELNKKWPKYLEDEILRNKNLKDKKVIIEKPSKEEKLKKAKRGKCANIEIMN